MRTEKERENKRLSGGDVHVHERCPEATSPPARRATV
jgi:hypothetical protein